MSANLIQHVAYDIVIDVSYKMAAFREVSRRIVHRDLESELFEAIWKLGFPNSIAFNENPCVRIRVANFNESEITTYEQLHDRARHLRSRVLNCIENHTKRAKRIARKCEQVEKEQQE